MRILSDRVLISKKPIEKKTESGLIIPDKIASKNEGTVILNGQKVKHIKVGDRIRYVNEAGIEIEYNGEKCLILREGTEPGVQSEIELILN